ncbi:DUF1850 domain-containing protein [Sulfurospirillum diekertiae]|uniref:DUF1850 domain-containing protein n=1 Tax=Sulfurospirillum diekertiae TaxID=1854492 RepID=A0A6G9VVX5_9BACT|nr:DUF1850 domain-containing protein [Sulfurospirillum diekertiae]QIR76817.1 DUF1850 domain-containing protein [Sulfurospirillum diekertiae]QIR79450.1 DUF1850 domain-containing protein [Sulfurospirillum diekertiae]
MSSGAVTVTLFLNSFTLAWMHSVEKIRWEEQWRIEGNSLHVLSASIRGSGAGMEPPLDSIFKEGAWHYTPHVPPQKELRLAHSPFTKEYELCFDERCTPLNEFFTSLPQIDTIVLEACER